MKRGCSELQLDSIEIHCAEEPSIYLPAIEHETIHQVDGLKRLEILEPGDKIMKPQFDLITNLTTDESFESPLSQSHCLVHLFDQYARPSGTGLHFSSRSVKQVAAAGGRALPRFGVYSHDFKI